MMLGTRLRSRVVGSPDRPTPMPHAKEIAKHMIEVAGRGERDQHILAEDAVRFLAELGATVTWTFARMPIDIR